MKTPKSSQIAAVFIFLISSSLGLLHLFSSISSPYYAGLYGDSLFFHQASLALNAGALQQWPLNATLSPVYLALLSFFYQMFPTTELLSVKVFQIFMNAVCCVLIFLISRRIWNFRTAVIAGFLSAFCGILIFYSVEIAKPSLINFLILLFLYSFFSLKLRPSLKILICAIVFSLACLLRMNLIIFIFPICLYLIEVSNKEAGYRKTFKPLFFLLIFWSVNLLSTMWLQVNVPNNRSPVSQWGIHFYIGNQTANSTGHYTKVEGVKGDSIGHVRDAKRIVKESGIENPSHFDINLFWLKKALIEIQNSPREWLVLLVRKFLLFINYYEIPSYDNYQYAKAYTPFLKWAGVGGWIVLPLGLLGFILSYRGPKKAEICGLQIFLIGYLITLLFTFLRADYRLPVYPVLLMFSAYAIDRLFEWQKVLNLKPLLLSLFIFAALFYCTNGFHWFDSEQHLSKMQKRIDRSIERNKDSSK